MDLPLPHGLCHHLHPAVADPPWDSAMVAELGLEPRPQLQEPHATEAEIVMEFQVIAHLPRQVQPLDGSGMT